MGWFIGSSGEAKKSRKRYLLRQKLNLHIGRKRKIGWIKLAMEESQSRSYEQCTKSEL